MAYEDYHVNADDVKLDGDPNIRRTVPPSPSGGGGGIAYGTCTTAAATAAKVVTLTDASGWELKQGASVAVKFSYTNAFSATSQDPVTLNVNNTGAKNIYYGGSANPTGANTTAFGRANYINTYVYDGTYWVWTGSSADNNTTYSAMSTSELTTGTATTSRVVRADYLKTGITSLINSNSYKRFSSSWVYNVKIVSSNASGQIVWIFTPNGYIVLETAGNKIYFRNSWVANASTWTYTKSGLTITLNTTDHIPMWVVANDNNISVTFTDTNTPQSNTFSNWVFDTANNTTTFTSSDTTDASATSWTSVTKLASGESHTSIFAKMSQMFKNIRYLYKSKSDRYDLLWTNTAGTFLPQTVNLDLSNYDFVDIWFGFTGPTNGEVRCERILKGTAGVLATWLINNTTTASTLATINSCSRQVTVTNNGITFEHGYMLYNGYYYAEWDNRAVPYQIYGGKY